MVYGDFKDLTRRTASDKALLYKVFSITENLKYNGYQRGLDSMVYNFFLKKASAPHANKYARGAIQNENMCNK